MSITNPAQLVAEYKKSGEFDRLRREMLSDFQRSEAVRPLLSRVEDIARQKLQADRKLEYLPQEAVHRELIAELDRYPLVERAVGEFRAKSDRSFPSEVRASLKDLLRGSQKGETKDELAKQVEEKSKSTVAVTTGFVQPVPAEEEMDQGDADHIGAEGTKKDEDVDAMDVERSSVQPPLEGTMANKHAKEPPTNSPTSTGKKDPEDDPRIVHQDITS